MLIVRWYCITVCLFLVLIWHPDELYLPQTVVLIIKSTASTRNKPRLWLILDFLQGESQCLQSVVSIFFSRLRNVAPLYPPSFPEVQVVSCAGWSLSVSEEAKVSGPLQVGHMAHQDEPWSELSLDHPVHRPPLLPR